MLFPVQDRLIKMGNAPPLRNMIVEHFRQFFGCLSGNGVTPCAEGYEKLSLFIERHITVHHRTETNRADFLQFRIVLFFHILCKTFVAILQPGPDIIQAIGPDAVLQPVLPVMGTGCDRRIILAHQNRFDPGRTEFNTEHCTAFFNLFLYFFRCKPHCNILLFIKPFFQKFPLYRINKITAGHAFAACL